MRTITVESPGLFTTVQDLGRPGYGPLGVSAAGAADPVALRLGNLLAGNAPGAAALELTLGGGVFVFSAETVAALAGANFGCALENEAVPPWSSFRVPAGGRLRFGPPRGGARCYLCVQGGVAVPEVFGIRSTHVPSWLGGLDGRPLRKDDILTIAGGGAAFQERRVKPAALRALYAPGPIRITHALQTRWFRHSQRNLLAAATYRISPVANRTGLRLEGPALPCERAGDMVTEGAALGAIQVPPSGEPILLLVDHQTTGGYPKIASVISADLHRAGQLRPGDEITFHWVTRQAARALMQERQRLLCGTELIQPASA